MSDTAAIIIAVITTLGVIIAAAFQHLSQARKTRREGVRQAEIPVAPPSPTDGWAGLVQALEARTTRLEERLGRMEDEIKAERDLRWSAIHYIRRLHDWIAQHMPDHAPPPPPDDLSPFITPRRDH